MTSQAGACLHKGIIGRHAPKPGNSDVEDLRMHVPHVTKNRSADSRPRLYGDDKSEDEAALNAMVFVVCVVFFLKKIGFLEVFWPFGEVPKTSKKQENKTTDPNEE